MNSEAFLRSLRAGLSGLPAHDVEEILADYVAHFAEARASGRSEAEVVGALGDPARLARELRAETGLRRFETHRSLGTLLAAMLALAGLVAVDILFLMPLLLAAGFVALGIGIGLVAFGIAGARIVLGVLFSIAHGGPMVGAVVRLLVGIGLVAGLIGGGSLLLLGLGAAVAMLGRYVRLHYRLLDPGSHNPKT